MAIAKRRLGVTSDINVTPMVDVMLVLLIIFMVVIPMVQKGASVTMAVTDNPNPMPDADKEDAILIAVMRDGQIFFGSDRIADPADLTTRVKDALANKTDKEVFVRADARAKFKSVVEVVDNVRSAGVDTLGLLTQQRRPLQEAPAPTTPTGAGGTQ